MYYRGHGRYLQLRTGLEDAGLVVAAFVTGMETVILLVAAILHGSWDLLGMNWQTGLEALMKNLEKMWWERVRDRDLLSTSPCSPFVGFKAL
jgi:hypothetical protein